LLYEKYNYFINRDLLLSNKSEDGIVYQLT
jgi:hypothetical protein